MNESEAIKAIETGAMIKCSRTQYYGGIRSALEKYAKRQDERAEKYGDKDAWGHARTAIKAINRLDNRF